MDFFHLLGDQILFYSSVLILACCIVLTFQTRFIQFRMVPKMVGMLFRKSGKSADGTVDARRALFTAMSTTIGISTIVSPIIAIRLGGPGAVVGFLVATLFGTAANFAEVTLAISYRKISEGRVLGGPMQYLHDAIAPSIARLYAFFGFLLLICWSSAQANQLSAILQSPLLGRFAMPPLVIGGVLALAVVAILLGGIRWIAEVSTRLVPLMFCLYVGASLWIILLNVERVPAVFGEIFRNCLLPQSFGTGTAIGGMVSALRWGIFKGLQSNEAGVGTQTIPHSMATVSSAVDQGILSMLSTYSAGFICLLSSLVTLLTGTWLDDTLALGISRVGASFQLYFSTMGTFVVAISAFLFGFGTILGNSFNGSQCFTYLTGGRFLKTFYLAAGVLIFWGALSEVTLVWSVVDFFLIPVVVPHILSVVYLSFKRKGILTN